MSLPVSLLTCFGAVRCLLALAASKASHFCRRLLLLLLLWTVIILTGRLVLVRHCDLDVKRGIDNRYHARVLLIVDC